MSVDTGDLQMNTSVNKETSHTRHMPAICDLPTRTVTYSCRPTQYRRSTPILAISCSSNGTGVLNSPALGPLRILHSTPEQAQREQVRALRKDAVGCRYLRSQKSAKGMGTPCVCQAGSSWPTGWHVYKGIKPPSSTSTVLSLSPYHTIL